MSTLSSEVLGRIFTLAAAAPVKTNPRDEIDLGAALLPYRVAAVNRHWRRAALAASQCWTYVALPAARRAAEAAVLKAHLTRVLDRSRSIPLDVVIHVGGTGDKSKAKQAADDDIFSMLVEHAGRIHTLMMRNDGEWALLRLLLDVLRRPTPQLHRLGIWCNHGDRVGTDEFNLSFPQAQFPTLLPDAPRLKDIIAYNAPVFCVQSHTVLPSLLSFSLLGRCVIHPDLAKRTLANMPKVEHLAITHIISSQSSDGSHDGPTSLPITVLDLDENAEELMTGIALPALHTLRMPSSGLGTVDVTSGSLTSLCLLRGAFSSFELDILRGLQNIEHASFVGEPDMDPAYIGAFFRALVNKQKPFWPQLRVLELRGIESAIEEEAELMRVIQNRYLTETGDNSEDDSDEGDAKDGKFEGVKQDTHDSVDEHKLDTARLEKVVFDGMSIEEETAEEIKAIMGDKCVLLQHEDYAYMDRLKNPMF